MGCRLLKRAPPLSSHVSIVALALLIVGQVLPLLSCFQVDAIRGFSGYWANSKYPRLSPARSQPLLAIAVVNVILLCRLTNLIAKFRKRHLTPPKSALEMLLLDKEKEEELEVAEASAGQGPSDNSQSRLSDLRHCADMSTKEVGIQKLP